MNMTLETMLLLPFQSQRMAIHVLPYMGHPTRPLHPAGNPAKNDRFFENTAR
jgi:hypothetical protein